MRARGFYKTSDNTDARCLGRPAGTESFIRDYIFRGAFRFVENKMFRALVVTKGHYDLFLLIWRERFMCVFGWLVTKGSIIRLLLRKLVYLSNERQ